MVKTKVPTKNEKQYSTLKVELERVTTECKDQRVQANKQLYIEKLEYATEILENMNKIKTLSHSNRVGLKFIKTSVAMLKKSTAKRQLVRVVNPFRLKKFHKEAKKTAKQDIDEGFTDE